MDFIKKEYEKRIKEDGQVDDQEFIDDMLDQNCDREDLVVWFVFNQDIIGGDDGYILDLIRYIYEN